MTNALPYIFFAGMAFACLSAAVSLFTPRTAIFFRNKTRPKGFFAWLGIAFVCFTCIGIFAPQAQREEAKAKKAVAEQAHLAPNPHESKADAETSITFQYKENSIRNDTDRHGRIRGATVFISPIDEGFNLNSNQISATCMAAAKYYAQVFSKKYNTPDNTLIDNILVVITDMPYDVVKYGKEIFYGDIGKLGQCHYVIGKSTGFFSYGKPEWQWLEVKASPRNTSEIEKQIEKFWINLHKKYKQGNRIADYALKKDIGLKLNINPEDINFTPVRPEKLDSNQFKDIAPHGPVEAQD